MYFGTSDLLTLLEEKWARKLSSLFKFNKVGNRLWTQSCVCSPAKFCVFFSTWFWAALCWIWLLMILPRWRSILRRYLKGCHLLSMGTWSIFFLLFLLQSWESVCYIWWPNAVFFYVSDEVNLNLQLIPKKGCCQVWSDSQICSITKEKEKPTNIY